MWWVGNDTLQTQVLTPTPACWVTSCPHPPGCSIPLYFTSFQLRNKGAKEILLILLKLWDGHVRRPSTVPGPSLHPCFNPLAFIRRYIHLHNVLWVKKGDFFSLVYFGFFCFALLCFFKVSAITFVNHPKGYQSLQRGDIWNKPPPGEMSAWSPEWTSGALPSLCPLNRDGPSAVTFRSFSWRVGTDWGCVIVCNVLCAAFCSS